MIRSDKDVEETLRAVLEKEGCHLAAVATAALSGVGDGAAAARPRAPAGGNSEGRALAEQRLDLQF